jgi:hypothetical protein
VKCGRRPQGASGTFPPASTPSGARFVPQVAPRAPLARRRRERLPHAPERTPQPAPADLGQPATTRAYRRSGQLETFAVAGYSAQRHAKWLQTRHFVLVGETVFEPATARPPSPHDVVGLRRIPFVFKGSAWLSCSELRSICTAVCTARSAQGALPSPTHDERERGARELSLAAQRRDSTAPANSAATWWWRASRRATL